jgi:hypothetical protein
MKIRLFSALLAVSVFIGLAGCAGSRPKGPVPPPPVPLLQTIPALPPSTFRIPIEVDLDYLAQKVQQSLPKPLSQDTLVKRVEVTLPGGFGIAAPMSVAFRHRATLEGLDLRLDGDRFQAVTRIGFAIGTGVSGGSLSVPMASCGERAGETPAGIEFTLKGKIAWGKDGNLALVQEPWNLRWTRPCALTAFKIRLEDVLDLPFVREKIAAAITGSLAKIPEAARLRPMAEQAWKELSAPREIRPGMILLTRPESLYVGPLRGTGKKLTTSLILKANPAVTGGILPADTVRPLPVIRVDSGADRGFRMELQASLPLTVVDSMLTAVGSAQKLEQGGKPVKIETIRVYGGGDKAVIAVRLSQPFAGEVFLKGVPEYDSLSHSVRFAQLDFDLETQSFLVRSAAWLLKGTLKDAIAKASVIPLEKTFGFLKDMKIPAGEGVTASVGVTRLRPLGISITDHELKAWVRADGKLQVVVAGRR